MRTLTVLVGNAFRVASVSHKETPAGNGQALFNITLPSKEKEFPVPYANRQGQQDWTYTDLLKESRTWVSPHDETLKSLMSKIMKLHENCSAACITCNGKSLKHITVENLLVANKNSELEKNGAFFSEGVKTSKAKKICKGNEVIIPEEDGHQTLQESLISTNETHGDRKDGTKEQRQTSSQAPTPRTFNKNREAEAGIGEGSDGPTEYSKILSYLETIDERLSHLERGSASPKRKRRLDVRADSDDELDDAQANSKKVAHSHRAVNRSQEVGAILRQTRFKQIQRFGEVRFDAAAQDNMEFRLRWILIFWLVSKDETTDWVTVVSEMIRDNPSSRGPIFGQATSTLKYTVQLQSLVKVNADIDVGECSQLRLAKAQTLLDSALLSCTSNVGHFELEAQIILHVKGLNYVVLMQSQAYLKASTAVRTAIESFVNLTMEDQDLNDCRLDKHRKRKKSSGAAPSKSGEKLMRQLAVEGMRSVILVSRISHPNSLKVLSSEQPSPGHKRAMFRLSQNPDLLNMMNGTAVDALRGRLTPQVKVKMRDETHAKEFAGQLCQIICNEIKSAYVPIGAEGVDKAVLPCHVIRSLCPGAMENSANYFRATKRSFRFLLSVMMSILCYKKVTCHAAEKNAQAEILNFDPNVCLSEYGLKLWSWSNVKGQSQPQGTISAAIGKAPRWKHDVCSNQLWQVWATTMKAIFESETSLKAATWPLVCADGLSQNDVLEGTINNVFSASRASTLGKDADEERRECASQNGATKSRQEGDSQRNGKTTRVGVHPSGSQNEKELQTLLSAASGHVPLSWLGTLLGTLPKLGANDKKHEEYLEILKKAKVETLEDVCEMFSKGLLRDSCTTSPFPAELRKALVSVFVQSTERHDSCLLDASNNGEERLKFDGLHNGKTTSADVHASGSQNREEFSAVLSTASGRVPFSLLETLRGTLRKLGALDGKHDEYLEILKTAKVQTLEDVGEMFVNGMLSDKCTTSPIPAELRIPLVSVFLLNHTMTKISSSEGHAKHLSPGAIQSNIDLLYNIVCNDRVSNPALCSDNLRQFQEHLRLVLPRSVCAMPCNTRKLQFSLEVESPKDFFGSLATNRDTVLGTPSTILKRRCISLQTTSPSSRGIPVTISEPISYLPQTIANQSSHEKLVGEGVPTNAGTESHDEQGFQSRAPDILNSAARLSSKRALSMQKNAIRQNLTTRFENS